MTKEIIEDKTPGSTPLTAEDMEGLKLSHITTKKELNRVEQENILEAEIKYFGKKYEVEDMLSWDFMKKLHKKMLQHVWTWASKQRRSGTNIGVNPAYIMTELPGLLGNVKYWIDNQTYDLDEIAARFHHGLVKIHPFTNGNGRHSRIMADLLLTNLGSKRFTWGSSNLYQADEVRDEYIRSLVLADKNEFSALNKFVRS
jgi:Fic-DOC domain mobile mystery protein B